MEKLPKAAKGPESREGLEGLRGLIKESEVLTGQIQAEREKLIAESNSETSRLAQAIFDKYSQKAEALKERATKIAHAGMGIMGTAVAGLWAGVMVSGTDFYGSIADDSGKAVLIGGALTAMFGLAKAIQSGVVSGQGVKETNEIRASHEEYERGVREGNMDQLASLNIKRRNSGNI